MDALALESEHGERSYLGPHLATALLDRGLRRALAKDEAGAFLRAASKDETPFVAAPVAREALERVRAHLQAERTSKRAEGVPDDELLHLVVFDGHGARCHGARVKTAFEEPGRRWNDRLEGPLGPADAWRDVSDGETRGWALRVLGDVSVRADGSIVRPGHVALERAPWFRGREEPITLRFVPLASYPSLLDAIAWVSNRLEDRVRFVSR